MYNITTAINTVSQYKKQNYNNKILKLHFKEFNKRINNL